LLVILIVLGFLAVWFYVWHRRGFAMASGVGVWSMGSGGHSGGFSGGGFSGGGGSFGGGGASGTW
jgi:uncharacterized protein